MLTLLRLCRWLTFVAGDRKHGDSDLAAASRAPGKHGEGSVKTNGKNYWAPSPSSTQCSPRGGAAAGADVPNRPGTCPPPFVQRERWLWQMSRSCSVKLRGANTSSTVSSMQREEVEKIKDLIDELRTMRQGSSGYLYRHYSGAISSLRHILRTHGADNEPG